MLCPAKICRSNYVFCGRTRASGQTNIIGVGNRQNEICNSVQTSRCRAPFCSALRKGTERDHSRLLLQSSFRSRLLSCSMSLHGSDYWISSHPSSISRYPLRFSPASLGCFLHWSRCSGERWHELAISYSGKVRLCLLAQNQTTLCFALNHCPVIWRTENRLFGYFTKLFRLLFQRPT